MNFNIPIERSHHVLEVDYFKEVCQAGLFDNMTGHARPSDGEHYSREHIYYSTQTDKIPDDVTHVVWFYRNKI